MNRTELSRETLAAKTYADGGKANRPLSRPIMRATVFSAASADSHARLYQQGEPTFYQRFAHASSDDAAEKIALLEGAEAAAAFASGMAAISTTLLAFLRKGKHIVCSEQVFAQTEEFLMMLSEDFGVRTEFVDTRDPAVVERAVTRETALVYVETPSNPQLRISDIAAIAGISGIAGVPLIVDSTFATPFGQQPLKLGADLVLHSGTKLLNGHMDAMCGFAAGRRDLVQKILETQRLLGGVLDPQASWLFQRGVRTLGVRTRQIFESAIEISRFLSTSPLVLRVRYPLFEGDPQYDLARKQMTGGGSVISFSLVGGRDMARAFVDSLQLIETASSLGGVETVIELPYDLDWVDAEARGEDNPDGGLVRLSVGLEKCDELIADLAAALSAVNPAD